MPKKTFAVITGPSRVGKTTIVDRLLKLIPHSARFVTTTTRPPRPNEKDGLDYHFRSREEFLCGVENGEFIESVESYGYLYGTSRPELSQLIDKNSVVFAATDTRGVVSLKREFPRAVTIFVKPGSIEELKKRIAESAELAPDAIQKRTAAVADKMRRANDFDYLVTNAEGRLEEAVQAVVAILANHIVWRIGLDHDDVIVDHTEHKIQAAKALGIEITARETPSEILEAKLKPGAYESYKKIKWNIYDNPEIAPFAQAIEGAKNGIKKLKEADLPIYLISYQFNPEMAITWLRRNGLWDTYFNEENTFFVKERGVKDAVARKLNLDVFLDDDPSNLKTMDSVPHRFLFDPFGVYPENPLYRKVKSWQEFIADALSL